MRSCLVPSHYRSQCCFLLIETLRTNFSEVWIKIEQFYTKMHFKTRRLQYGVHLVLASMCSNMFSGPDIAVIIYFFLLMQYICILQLRLRQNGRCLADDILKCICLNFSYFDLSFIEICPHGYMTNTKPTLFQMMAWRRTGAKLFSEREIYASVG